MKLSLKPAAVAIALAAAFAAPTWAGGDKSRADAATHGSSATSSHESTLTGTGTVDRPGSTLRSDNAGDRSGSRSVGSGAIDDRASGSVSGSTDLDATDRATTVEPGLRSQDRTGMTGADAGSTSLRGDYAYGAHAEPEVHTDAVPLMEPGARPEPFSMTPSGVRPNSPFDSEVTTMGQRPL